ncbi:SPX domain-containing protein 1-like [Zingiber officinale]|uniref:SPX domain-containing protein 1-like n=1 Tax=Zingiber officinale TaxID=94328 RepID=UPI001C4AF946|nr:SPX domain-containing protein 1-like [Zingiber officinale]
MAASRNARLLTDEATEEKGDRESFVGAMGDLVGKLRGRTCRLVKILKKYDKRTGALIRQPFIEKVLQQPFFTTDLLCKLVKECVAMLDHLFPSNNLSISAECDGQNRVPKPAQSGGRVLELEEIKYMQSLYMKSTVAALRSLKQIRSKSSTVKTD